MKVKWADVFHNRHQGILSIIFIFGVWRPKVSMPTFVNTKQHGKQTYRNTSNQSTRAKSFHAHIVNTKQQGKLTFRDTSNVKSVQEGLKFQWPTTIWIAEVVLEGPRYPVRGTPSVTLPGHTVTLPGLTVTVPGLTDTVPPSTATPSLHPPPPRHSPGPHPTRSRTRPDTVPVPTDTVTATQHCPTLISDIC